MTSRRFHSAYKARRQWRVDSSHRTRNPQEAWSGYAAKWDFSSSVSWVPARVNAGAGLMGSLLSAERRVAPGIRLTPEKQKQARPQLQQGQDWGTRSSFPSKGGFSKIVCLIWI